MFIGKTSPDVAVNSLGDQQYGIFTVSFETGASTAHI